MAKNIYTLNIVNVFSLVLYLLFLYLISAANIVWIWEI